MTDPDNIPIFNMSPPQVVSSSNSDINKVRLQFPMNHQHFEPCSSLDPSHSFTRPRIPDNEHSIDLMDPPSRMNHPPSNNQAAIIFFKTRLCTKFMSRSCIKGENCTYAHAKEELRQPPPNWKELQRLHLGGNSCINSENCSYAHGKEELRQPPPNWQELQWQQLGGNRDTAKFMNDSWKKRESAAITIRTIGNNLEGSKTVTKPPRGTYWKTKICPKSKHTRSCTYGDDCNFAHGDAELQVPGGGGIEAEAAVTMTNSTKAVTPTLRTTRSSAKYAPTLPARVSAMTEEEKKVKKELLWKKLNKINRIYGDWIDDLSPERPDLPREP
ncbi:hypothetical protein KIW84_041367 [Lathyrus oleraceus]|uniref:C3H1-type domain-containing protein n=1 Tax=Pisum sativum TaxID=3888 RepID=A0A9D5AP73_PEA|nr:hypothetical protein KIW84_041367 [Pisum sativum]